MRSTRRQLLRVRLTALLLAVAFIWGFAHCVLESGCADGDGPNAPVCHVCWCHAPMTEAAPVAAVSHDQPVTERVETALEPNDRLAVHSIFHPPKV